MGNILILYWAAIVGVIILWFVEEPSFPIASNVFQIRERVVQLSGVLVTSLMSIAMMLVLWPSRPERWLGGLDRMYRLEPPRFCRRLFHVSYAAVAGTAHIWFCGPARFANAPKQDLAANGFPTDRSFHQELFTMR